MRLWTSAGENVLYSYDSGNIALAVEDYNISEERPHLPGYFLYVQSLRLINNFTGNTQQSIIILMSVFSALGSGLLYLLLCRYYNRKISLLISLLFITNPLVWFFGSIAEIYSFDLFFSLILVLSGMSRKYIFLMPVILAAGMGFRPSSGLILLPLFFWFLIKYIKETKNYRILLISNLLGLLVLLAWVLPMLNSCGGFLSFIKLIRLQNPVPPVSVLRNTLQLLTMGIWMIIPLVLLALMNLFKREKLNITANLKTLTLLILVPALLIFIFVHYARGYLLITIPAMALLTTSMSNRRPAQIFLMLWILLQTAYFLFMPFKLQSANIFYLPSQRRISQTEVLWERFLSQNSLTLSHIRKTDELYSEIRKAKNEYPQFKYILIDPTVLIKARTLQATISGVFFAELNTVRQDGYFLYKDMKQYNLAGRQQLLDSSLIVSFEPFVISIPHEYIKIIKQTNDLIFYTCKKNKENELIRIYNKYFLKK